MILESSVAHVEQEVARFLSEPVMLSRMDGYAAGTGTDSGYRLTWSNFAGEHGILLSTRSWERYRQLVSYLEAARKEMRKPCQREQRKAAAKASRS